MSEPGVNIRLTADSAQLLAGLAQVRAEFNRVFTSINAQAVEARASLNKAFSSLDIRSLADIRAESDRVRAAFANIATYAGASSAEAQRAFAAMQTKLAALEAEARGAGAAVASVGPSSGISGLAASVGPAIAAFIGLGAAVKGVQSVIDAGMGIEKLQGQLKFATGSVEGATDAMGFLKATSRELGLEFGAVSSSFGKFAASAKGTKLEGEGVRDVFTAVAKASSVMKLSSEETQGTFLALGQMISKGKVQAEELRGQLGERLPGAFNIAARAMGVTTAELDKMLAAGQVISEDFLPKFAVEMERTFGQDAKNSANTLQGAMNQLSNAWGEFKQVIADSGVMEFATKKLQEWIAAIDEAKKTGELQQRAKEVGDAIVAVGKVIAGVIEFVARYSRELTTLAGVAAGVKFTNMLLELGAFIGVAGGATAATTALTTAMRGLPLVMAAMGGYAIGTWINDNVVNPMINGSRASDEQVAAVARVKSGLEALSQVRYGEAFKTEAAKVRDAIASSTAETTRWTQWLIDQDRKQSESAKVAADAKAEAVRQYTAKAEDDEKALKDRVKEIERAKNAEAVTAGRQRLDQQKDIDGARDRLAAETSAKVVGHSKQEVASLKLSHNQAVAAAKARAQGEAAEMRTLTEAHSKRVLDFKDNEAKIKAALEEGKEARKKIEAGILADAVAAYQARMAEINRTEAAISSLVLRALGERNAAEAAANREAIRQTSIDAAAKLKQIDINARLAVAAEADALKQRLAEEQSFIGMVKSLLGAESTIHKDHAATMKTIAVESARAMVAEKQKQYDALLTQHRKYEGDLKAHADKIKEIEKSITDFAKGAHDIEFDIKMMGMSDAQKGVAIMGEIRAKTEEMGRVRAEAAAKGNSADAETIKQQKELYNDITGLARQYVSAASSSGEYADKQSAVRVALEAVGNARQMVTGQYEDAKTVEEAAMAGIKQKIEDTRGAMVELAKQISTLVDIKEIAIKIDIQGEDAVSTSLESIQKLRDFADKEMTFTLGINADKANAAIDETIAKAKTPTDSIHTVKPDTQQAQAEIERLKRDTQSYHTVYVRTVEQHAEGGIAGSFRRAAGMISGPGSETSDSVPSLLSRGEFVVRAAAVRKWGVGFMQSLNAGFLPAMPRFASGGLMDYAVQTPAGGGAGSRDIVDIRFDIGGRSIMAQSSRDHASQLVGALRELSRGA